MVTITKAILVADRKDFNKEWGENERKVYTVVLRNFAGSIRETGVKKVFFLIWKKLTYLYAGRNNPVEKEIGCRRSWGELQ